MATGSAILSILTPSVVTKIVSTIRAPGSILSRHFGWQIGGANVMQVQGKTYTYDIYDHVRAVARGRVPGSASGSISLNPVGNVSVTLAKSAEKVMLDYNAILQIRTIGENAGSRDVAGKRYVEKQAKTLRQRQDNFREFVVAGAICNGGTYGFYISGDDLVPTFSSTANITVDHRIPAANKLIGATFVPGLILDGTANIINAPWSVSSTDIPNQLLGIDSGLQGQAGNPLKHIIVNNQVWSNVIANDKVRQLAGTSNSPFAQYDKLDMKNPDGTDAGVFAAVLKGLPQFEWLICNSKIKLATTNATTEADTRVVQDGYATFMIENDNSWIQMIEGSEIVKDNDLAPPVEREGFYSWMLEKADPARFELHGLQSVGMEINVPKGLAVARVQDAV